MNLRAGHTVAWMFWRDLMLEHAISLEPAWALIFHACIVYVPKPERGDAVWPNLTHTIHTSPLSFHRICLWGSLKIKMRLVWVSMVSESLKTHKLIPKDYIRATFFVCFGWQPWSCFNSCPCPETLWTEDWRHFSHQTNSACSKKVNLNLAIRFADYELY